MTTTKPKRAIATIGLLAGLALAGATAFAQTDAAPKPGSEGNSMMDHRMPSGAMPGMMMNGEMQEKMSRMMDNCNHMMVSMMQNGDRTPQKQD